MNRRQFLTRGVTLSAPIIAGCMGGGGQQTTETPTPTPTETVSKTVKMKDVSFNPVRVTIAPGGTVKWINKDSFRHTVTSGQFHDKAKSWNFDKIVGTGKSLTRTFDEAGVYEYYCTIHGKSSMCGAVLVGDASLDKSLPCE